MLKLTPDRDLSVQKIRFQNVPILILRPKHMLQEITPGLLWLHGGGYFTGMKELVYMSRAADLVKKFGITAVVPGYRLSFQAPYPAAIRDCYMALDYMHRYADELGIDPSKLMVGGESAGGGLTAAVCMLARDLKRIPIAYQFPLYPMLSNLDTESSADNHGKIWNSRVNHLGWRLYLRGDAKHEVSPYAAPANQKDYSGLPPAYTFVGDGEPFYQETLDYIQHLHDAGIKAEVDIYRTDIHAFDMLFPKKAISREAILRFEDRFAEVLGEL